MDCMYEAYLAHDALLQEPDDIPQTKEPVWVLGKQYDREQELERIREDIHSRLWFTYRRGFVPIGHPDGHTSDRGWGCMLRCGQMVLAQALLLRHLGTDWRWQIESRDATYMRIVHGFEDTRQAPYSIHQIALMGASSEGRDVGQWFGPNTVAQVLKKLVKYDDWSSVQIHVALDNTVVINDIKDLCFIKSISQSSSKSLLKNNWRPLLLIVPLRLGLTEINPIYVSGLQTCFQFSQSLGVIGGKPNLALYFIGCVGEEVIYLDPHTTQRCGSIGNKETEDQIELDMTYHCKRASHMNILQMDPSVAVCFFCKTEAEFTDLIKNIKDRLILPEKQPLFEISIDRPTQWIPNLDLTAEEALVSQVQAFDSSDPLNDSENEFEIL